jgi:hypothetical protein
VWECRLVLGSGAGTLAQHELRDYRHAVTAVAPFVRQYACGAGCEVRLEIAEGTAWRVVERWGSDVVERILEQTTSTAGVTRPTPTPPIRPARGGEAEHAGVRPALARSARGRPRAADRQRTHRWHVGTTLVVAAAGWALLAVYFTGGRPLELFEQSAKASMVQPSELPFHRSTPAVRKGVPQFDRSLSETTELPSGNSRPGF